MPRAPPPSQFAARVLTGPRVESSRVEMHGGETQCSLDGAGGQSRALGPLVGDDVHSSGQEPVASDEYPLVTSDRLALRPSPLGSERAMTIGVIPAVGVRPDERPVDGPASMPDCGSTSPSLTPIVALALQPLRYWREDPHYLPACRLRLDSSIARRPASSTEIEQYGVLDVLIVRTAPSIWRARDHLSCLNARWIL